MKHRLKLLVPALLTALSGIACAPTLSDGFLPPAQEPVAAAGRTPGAFLGEATVMVGAGDIAYDSPGAEATARLLDQIAGTVFVLGDNAYQSGAPSDYARYYAPTWGRHLQRTRPVVGNHEYRTPGAAGYFGYFGARAGDPAKGYYAYDVNPAWHVVVLNSASSAGDDASPDLGPQSAQYGWLVQDLEAHHQQNVIAMWHHPRFSTGVHGDNKETDAIWQLLYTKGVDIALWGHDHDYERFVPMDGRGEPNDQTGIRAFVVGTGGKNHYKFTRPAKRTTAVRDDKTFGVLKLSLFEQGYDWEFVPEAGGKFTDAGRSTVH